MFGYRKDGIKLKKVDPIIRFTSYIMPRRYDAQCEITKEVLCDGMDQFIRQQGELGVKISYMHIVVAAIVRMLALRPRLNRFIMSGRVYARKKIYISFAVKKHLDDDAEETTIKLGFTGHESLFEIKQMMDQEIAKSNISKEPTKTDKMANKLLKLPHIILAPAVGFLKMLDKLGIMPNAVVEASPFHTSCFVTNLKSIGTEHIYHQIYDFGTCGIFVAMGKEKMQPVVDENNNIVPAKIMKLGIVLDERLADGFYGAKSLKVAVKHMQNPSLLTERLESVMLDPDL